VWCQLPDSEPKGRGAAWTEERGATKERRATREGGAFKRPGGERGGTVALLRLPARQREVVALRLFLDLDIARTAEVLGIAPGTVRAHLTRATAALREDLAPAREQENRS
jgi:DNA-binding CsgD family transcriptional regulator